MRINLASVLVDDQQKALRFYTDVLGFVKKTDIPMGGHSWLTLVSPEDPDGVELVLEPSEHPAVAPFKAALGADTAGGRRIARMRDFFEFVQAELGDLLAKWKADHPLDG